MANISKLLNNIIWDRLYLAQLSASQLNKTPLILPLLQKEYGGKIELSEEDYHYMKGEIEKHKVQFDLVSPRALIVDDSILSGSSIWTMLGFAELLGLKTTGVVVLLNRLSTEVSAALDALPFEFGYLYRLHMSILSESQSPDTQVLKWSREIEEDWNSYFMHEWSSRLGRYQGHSHFFADKLEIEALYAEQKGFDRVDFEIQKETLEGTHNPHEIRQIIEGLILHKDPNILDFYSRLAVSYNFLERLVNEKAFWLLLDAFVEASLDHSRELPESHFVRKLVFLTSFSRYISTRGSYERFRDFCLSSAAKCFSNSKLVKSSELLCDLFMALGTIGSERLVSLGNSFLLKWSDRVLRQQPEGGDEHVACIELFSAYAWSNAILSAMKGVELYDGLRQVVVDMFNSVKRSDSGRLRGEKQLLLFDVYEPFLMMDTALRQMLGIRVWDDEEEFLSRLGFPTINYRNVKQHKLKGGIPAKSFQMKNAVGEVAEEHPKTNIGQNPIIAYLCDAPGYSFTLKTVLKICKADTALLFSKSDSDDHFFIRDFDTRSSLSPDQQLSSQDLRYTVFPAWIRMRMDKGLFFFSDSKTDLKALRQFSANTPHKWMFGAEVRRKVIGERYYLVLGYSGRDWDNDSLRTAYYYWVRSERMLQVVLPAIHEKHIRSSSSWNALIQSLRPIHFSEREDYSEKKKLLSYAMAHIDLGDLLRRAVNTNRQRAFSAVEVIRHLRKNIHRLRDAVGRAARDMEYGESDSPIPTDKWPVRFDTTKYQIPDGVEYLSVHNTILEFVLYECLCNALTNYRKRIEVQIDFSLENEGKEQSGLRVLLDISNDYEERTRGESSGLEACKKAAHAVKGDFTYEDDESKRLWRAKLELPAYLVPRELTRRWVHELL